MNKKLIVLLAAALLLISVSACNSSGDGDDTTKQMTDETTGAYIDPSSTTADETETEPTLPPETEFTEKTAKVVVITAVATVRSSASLATENRVGWPKEGTVLDVTGEGTNWYRINYTVNGEVQPCYIAKTVVDDAAVLDTFTECDDELIVSVAAVNVRSYPSSASASSIRGSLTKGTKVKRVGATDTWSKIEYQVTSETETDAEGAALVETKYYYVSNDCLALPGADTGAANETTAG